MKTLPALCLAALSLWTAPAAAQVVISEVNFTPQSAADDQWIELVNLGTTKADISSWSLYLSASSTSNYWFGFPAGTEIPSGGFLRVHWFVPVKPSTATDVYTGDTVFHFLFGYGGTPIPVSGGALALLNTQSNLKMNDPASIEDWLSWGGNGWKRETLAVAANKWVSSAFVTASVEKDSIARNLRATGQPVPVSAFFHDASPNPLQDNAGGALSLAYGDSCSSGSINGAGLAQRSVAAIGNRDYGMTFSGTAATSLGQFAVLLVSGAQASLPIGNCTIYVDPTVLAVLNPVPTTVNSTDVPLPLIADIQGATLYFQGIVIPAILTPVDYGFTNGLRVTCSNL